MIEPEVDQDLLLSTDDAQVWATAMETAERIQREKYAEAQS